MCLPGTKQIAMREPNPPKPLVLYADDDPDDIDYVRTSFKDHAKAIDIRTFPDGECLMQWVYEKHGPAPCLVILDINMPRLDGRQALEMLRNIRGYESVPVVLFSTSTAPQDARFALHHGAELIPKPLHEQQMSLIVSRFLERCESTEESR
jgi:CheY-like chemotaxis protein